MTFHKGLCVGSAVLMTVLTVSGCVTRGTYERLEAEKDREIAALRVEREALQRERAELREQVEQLESRRAALENRTVWLNQEQVGLQTRIGLLAQEKEALEEQQAELREQIGRLERQKSDLLVSSRETETQYNALVRNLTEEVQKGELQVRQYRNMLTVDVAERLFFDSGEATLKASGQEVLAKLGETLSAYDDKIVRIIGHTDNVPISKAHRKVYPSNWELSVARATTVVRYLQEIGISPERMVASGRAAYAPVAPNGTADGRRKNRRIEITLVDRSLVERMGQAVE